MSINQIIKLTVPPEWGYGNFELKHIQANSTLIFEIELLSITVDLLKILQTEEPYFEVLKKGDGINFPKKG